MLNETERKTDKFLNGATNGSEFELTGLFTGGRFRQVSPQFTKAVGYYPNELWYSEKERVTLIVAARSSGIDSDFALNEKALADIRAYVDAGRIQQAHVVFVEGTRGQRNPLGHKTVDDAARCLYGIPPLNGRHGAFWWIDSETALGIGYVPDELRPM